jgi:hypothetical protein
MEDQNTGLGSMTGREAWNFIAGCGLVYVIVFVIMAYPALVIGVACSCGDAMLGFAAWFFAVCFIVWCLYNSITLGSKKYKTILYWLYALTLSPFLQYYHWIDAGESYGYGKYHHLAPPEGFYTGDDVPFHGFRWLAPLDFGWATEAQNAENFLLLYIEVNPSIITTALSVNNPRAINSE